jgi:hypothetical protein
MSERINYIQEEHRHDDILWVEIGRESSKELRDFCQKQGMIFPMYQYPDGKIYMTYTYRLYTIKPIEINENWLTHTSHPN